MPIGDIAGEALGGIVRVIARIIAEVIFELTIKGTGYVLLRFLRPKSEPGDTVCAFTGLLFWAGVVIGGFWLYRHMAVA